MKVQLFVLLFLFSFSIRSVFGQEYIFEYKDFFDLMEQIDRLHPPRMKPRITKIKYKKDINKYYEIRTSVRKRHISDTDATKIICSDTIYMILYPGIYIISDSFEGLLYTKNLSYYRGLTDLEYYKGRTDLEWELYSGPKISEYTALLNRIKRGEYIASQPTSCVGWTWKAPMNPYKPPYLFLSLVRVSPSAFSCRTSFLYYSKYVNPNQLFLIDCTKEEIPEQFVNQPGGDS